MHFRISFQTQIVFFAAAQLLQVGVPKVRKKTNISIMTDLVARKRGSGKESIEKVEREQYSIVTHLAAATNGRHDKSGTSVRRYK